MYLLNRNPSKEQLEPRVKSTVLTDRKCLFNYIVQSSYCIIEIFNRSFLKNNIETKDGCKFDKIIRENL